MSTSMLPHILSGTDDIDRLSPIKPSRFDAKGRQIQFVETPEQKCLRQQFVHRREWARRVSAWVSGREAEAEHLKHPISPRPTSARDLSYMQNMSDPRAHDALHIEHHFDESEDEPYIFYTSSPSSSASSPSLAPSPSTSPLSLHDDGHSTFTHDPKILEHANRRRIRRARKLNLHAISEVPEDD
ncbi:hypothetical protein PLICRDRAFT_29224 [Plicaturopsis crispa FD-325 SS-3]|nr:hypothetical protein PLICRDRAFT_29224 [Plicaturopsis crispa FD-325 SS-3]